MATTTTTNADLDIAGPLSSARVPAWPTNGGESDADHGQKPSHRDALQALLAFSALHDQIRRRKALASRQNAFDSPTPISEFEPAELFVLDEVLQLVAERAVSITGSDGLAIALAENNEIVLRAAAGTICPDPGTRIDRDSAFSGACFRTAQIVICDDTETDPRVNLQSCRKLGARSMVAVPLCGRRRVIGVLEAFSSWPFAFNEIDVRNLSLLAELVLGALKPEDEDRFAQSAQIAATKLEAPKAESLKLEMPKADASKSAVTAPIAAVPPKPPISGMPTGGTAASPVPPRIPLPPKPALPIEAAKVEAPKLEALKPTIPQSAIAAPATKHPGTRANASSSSTHGGRRSDGSRAETSCTSGPAQAGRDAGSLREALSISSSNPRRKHFPRPQFFQFSRLRSPPPYPMQLRFLQPSHLRRARRL